MKTFTVSFFGHRQICDIMTVERKLEKYIRNRTMADRSDIIIFCVDHNSGGAFQTLQYAKNNKVAYVNLCDKVKLEK